MLTTNASYLQAFMGSGSKARQITGKVTYYNAADEAVELLPNGQLTKFSIEKVPLTGKLFGIAITQKITVEALGIHNIPKGAKVVPFLGAVGLSETVKLPNFYVDNVEINKVNNTTKIVGYDIIYTSNIPVKEITITAGLNMYDYTVAYCEGIGASVYNVEGYTAFSVGVPNFDGHEVAQTVLAQIAEATGTICYVRSEDTIRFRKLEPSYVAGSIITTNDYFEFTTGESIEINELGYKTSLDNSFAPVINPTAVQEGYEPFAQVLQDNAFYFAGESQMDYILGNLGNEVFGLRSTAYKLTWRGCPAYELGDWVVIQERDKNENNVYKYVYYLGETLEYNGGLRAVSEWETISSERVDAQPATLSKALGQTYAKVDKVNQEITLLAQKVDETSGLVDEVASLKVATDSITAQVENLENSVETKLSPDSLSVLISSNVNSVTTTTGYTFNSIGLSIATTGAATSTEVNTNGMKIYNVDNEEVLVVNNGGVDALNLKAQQYLDVGGSRFIRRTDKKGIERTACYWVG